MPLVAIERLRWGDGYIEPGEPVPEGEAGRDYNALVRLHQAAEVVEHPDLSALEAERDEAVTRAEKAEAEIADAQEAVNAAQAALAEAAAAVADANARIGQLEQERDDLAKQVEDLTAPADPAPAEEPAEEPAPKRAAKKPPAK